METETASLPHDPHQGRPQRPEHAERGAALMAQWMREDRTSAVDELIDLRQPVSA